tara:strand:- start:69 stop:734 length:666 start_codon:yes stop_codon:yes gene_type:complete
MEMQMGETKFYYDLGLFGDTLNRVILREYPHRTKDFINSFLSNQINCKIWLIEELTKILERKKDHFIVKRVTVLGSWYGNIIVPLLIDNIPTLQEIDLIDMDEDALAISRKFLSHYNFKINYMHKDINFEEFENHYTNVVINTSCEHMVPMDSIIFKNDGDVIYALQSNNMSDIREHVNCVNSEISLAIQANVNRAYYCGEKRLIGKNSKKYTRFMVIGKR